MGQQGKSIEEDPSTIGVISGWDRVTLLSLALFVYSLFCCAMPFFPTRLKEFFNYALSFILLAIFRIIHHQQFHFIKRTDHTHLWIYIFSLMFVALVPFSTSLTGDYPDETVAKLFFDLNLFILGTLNVLNWTYATKDYRLVDRGLDPRRIAVGNRRDAVIPVVALLAMVLSLIIPKWSSCVYLLIPIMLAHPWFRHKKT